MRQKTVVTKRPLIIISCALQSQISHRAVKRHFRYTDALGLFVLSSQADHAIEKRCFVPVISLVTEQINKLHGLSPRANYTNRATVASRRSGCQLLRINGAAWSA
jgi:hypothetical protein